MADVSADACADDEAQNGLSRVHFTLSNSDSLVIAPRRAIGLIFLLYSAFIPPFTSD